MSQGHGMTHSYGVLTETEHVVAVLYIHRHNQYNDRASLINASSWLFSPLCPHDARGSHRNVGDR